MKKIKLAVLIFSSIAFSGCKEEIKTELWYQQNPDEAYKVYTECLKNNTSNQTCENAKKAAIHFKNFGTEEQQEKFSKVDEI